MLKKRHADSLFPGPLFDGSPCGDEFCPIIQNFASLGKVPDSIKQTRSSRIIEIPIPAIVISMVSCGKAGACEVDRILSWPASRDSLGLTPKIIKSSSEINCSNKGVPSHVYRLG